MNSALALSPPVGRSIRRTTRIFVAFTLGLLLGGTTTAGLLWSLSGLVPHDDPRATAIILISIGVLLVLRDLRVFRFRLPERRRLIPQTVFNRGVMRGALVFGYGLGLGFVTYVSSGAPYLLAASLVAVQPAPAVAISAGFGFGMGRAVMVWSRLASGDPAGWDERLQQRLSWSVPLSTGVTALVVSGLALA